jgi:hypothetical protein
MPQLDPNVEMQFRWMQFLVWRRWMAVAALIISISIAAVTVGDSIIRFRIYDDKVRRCDAGMKSGFDKNYDPEYGTTNPNEIMENMLKKFSASQSALVMKGMPTGAGVNLEEFNVPPLSAPGLNHKLANTNRYVIGECRWAPFESFSKMPGAPPQVVPEGSASDPFATLKNPNLPFLNVDSAKTGCHPKDKKQYAQQRSCLCSYNLQTWEDYKVRPNLLFNSNSQPLHSPLYDSGSIWASQVSQIRPQRNVTSSDFSPRSIAKHRKLLTSRKQPLCSIGTSRLMAFTLVSVS